MNNNYKIQILLATYNGGEYLSTQIESILNQTYSNWVMFISDDGSTDSTLAIIQDYCAKDHRIRIVNKALTGQSACQNFGNMLKVAFNEEWDFVMFADQDDFWFEDKIQLTLDLMIYEENFKVLPKLIYTDFEYADEKLNPLTKVTDKNSSGWTEPNLGRLLAQNNIYGCTMMINRILAEKANPIPICAENHDYWLALVAALLGEIGHVKKRTILYRQHSNNVSGHYTNNSLKLRIQRYYRSNEKLEKIMKGRFKMAEELNNRFYKDISEMNQKLLVVYADFEKKKGLERVFFCLQNGIEKNSVLQNLAFYYSLARI